MLLKAPRLLNIFASIMLMPKARTCYSPTVTKQSVVRCLREHKDFIIVTTAPINRPSVFRPSNCNVCLRVLILPGSYVSTGPGNQTQQRTVNTAGVMWEEGYMFYMAMVSSGESDITAGSVKKRELLVLTQEHQAGGRIR